MIGTFASHRRDVEVIGGGFSGLVSAYFLDKHGYRVTIHEASNRLGGLISTKKTEFGLAESAANSLVSSPALLSLCQELNLPLVPVNAHAHAKFIFRDGQMRKFPLSCAGVAQTLYHSCCKRFGGEPLTLADWGKRFVGKEATQFLLEPMVTGIYAAKAEEISVAAAFPRLVPKIGQTLIGKQVSDLLKGLKQPRRQILVPLHGMESLVRRLSEHLEKRLGERLRLNSRLGSLSDSPNSILCVSPRQASLLMGEHMAEAQEIKYSPLATVTAFLDKAKLSALKSGIGVLIPPSEQRGTLGVLFSSNAFAHRVANEDKLASLTFLIGGTRFPEMVNLTDAEFRDLIVDDFERLFGIRTSPLHLEVSRYQEAIPIYSFALERFWEKAANGWCQSPGRILLSNYTGQVSLRGILEEASNLGLKSAS